MMLINIFGYTIIIIMCIGYGKFEFYVEEIRRD